MGRRDDAFGCQTSCRLCVFAGAADCVAGRTRGIVGAAGRGRGIRSWHLRLIPPPQDQPVFRPLGSICLRGCSFPDSFAGVPWSLPTHFILSPGDFLAPARHDSVTSQPPWPNPSWHSTQVFLRAPRRLVCGTDITPSTLTGTSDCRHSTRLIPKATPAPGSPPWKNPTIISPAAQARVQDTVFGAPHPHPIH